MWIVVLMLGVLNTTPQFPAGHSEMTDFPAPFESEAACKASLYAIVENAQGDMDARFGDGNIFVVGRCWTPPGNPA